MCIWLLAGRWRKETHTGVVVIEARERWWGGVQVLANSRLRRHDRDLYSTIINQVSLWRCILSRGKSIGKEKGGGRRGRGEKEFGEGRDVPFQGKAPKCIRLLPSLLAQDDSGKPYPWALTGVFRFETQSHCLVLGIEPRTL